MFAIRVLMFNAITVVVVVAVVVDDVVVFVCYLKARSRIDNNDSFS